jgi:hypothetical protein
MHGACVDEKAVNKSEYRCTAEAPSLLGITSRIAAMTTIKGITELESEGLTYHEWRAHTEPVLFTAGYGIYFLSDYNFKKKLMVTWTSECRRSISSVDSRTKKEGRENRGRMGMIVILCSSLIRPVSLLYASCISIHPRVTLYASCVHAYACSKSNRSRSLPVSPIFMCTAVHSLPIALSLCSSTHSQCWRAGVCTVRGDHANSMVVLQRNIQGKGQGGRGVARAGESIQGQRKEVQGKRAQRRECGTYSVADQHAAIGPFRHSIGIVERGRRSRPPIASESRSPGASERADSACARKKKQ